VTFSEFYASYPKKVARKDAEKAWAKLSPNERAKALEALPTHIRWWELKGTDKEFIPHPATWLNGARFDDELDLTERLPKTAIAWWSTDDGVIKKGAELGVRARGGETMHEYKARLIDLVRRGVHAA
jgi:hypothetical protein